MDYQAKVEGMSCNGCANAVKAAFSNVEGVSQVNINLDKKEATFEASQKVTKKQLENALEDTSYRVESLN